MKSFQVRSIFWSVFGHFSLSEVFLHEGPETRIWIWILTTIIEKTKSTKTEKNQKIQTSWNSSRFIVTCNITINFSMKNDFFEHCIFYTVFLLFYYNDYHFERKLFIILRVCPVWMWNCCITSITRFHTNMSSQV